MVFANVCLLFAIQIRTKFRWTSFQDQLVRFYLITIFFFLSREIFRRIIEKLSWCFCSCFWIYLFKTISTRSDNFPGCVAAVCLLVNVSNYTRVWYSLVPLGFRFFYQILYWLLKVAIQLQSGRRNSWQTYMTANTHPPA